MSEERSLSKSEILKTLFKKYGLVYDGTDSRDNDLFKHKHYTIITRSGIEKIQKAANIKITYDPIYVTKEHVVLHAKGFRQDDGGNIIDSVETFGSAGVDNSSNNYYPEMAEKRAMSRIVLKLAGLYELGVYGADEADEWKDAARTRQITDNRKSVYKGN